MIDIKEHIRKIRRLREFYHEAIRALWENKCLIVLSANGLLVLYNKETHEALFIVVRPYGFNSDNDTNNLYGYLAVRDLDVVDAWARIKHQLQFTCACDHWGLFLPSIKNEYSTGKGAPQRLFSNETTGGYGESFVDNVLRPIVKLYGEDLNTAHWDAIKATWFEDI